MSLNEELRPWTQRIMDLYQVWVEGRAYPDRAVLATPGGLLKFLDSAGGRILEAGYFVAVALRQDALAGILVMLIAAVFFLSRHSAAIELDIGQKLFPAGRLPKRWSGRRDSLGVTLSVIVFFALYMVLAWVAGNVRLVSLILLAIACIDFNTRRLIGAKMGGYFRDMQYMLNVDDKDQDLIEARRTEVSRFLYDKPHLLKEGGRILGCAMALGISVEGEQLGNNLAAPVAYLCLIATLLINEIVTWRWRAERDHHLWELEGIHTQPIGPFSLIAWAASVVFVVVSAVVAWNEGTFNSSVVTMGFVNHGGMWSDLMIMPVVNGLIVPYLPKISVRRAAVLTGLFAVALSLTLVAHWQWAASGAAQGVTDHVFPIHGADRWYLDLSHAGRLHVVYMSLEITLILAYICLSTPRATVVVVTALLTVHVIIGQVQPAWYSSGTALAAGTVVPTVTSVLAVWLVAIVKIRRQGSGVLAASLAKTR